MNPIINVALFGLVSGLIVAFGTSAFLGKAKARRVPGGSLSSGFAGAIILGQPSIGFIILGAVCGLLGWGIFLLLTRSRHKTKVFHKRKPGKGEKLCPYDGVAYRKVPGYVFGYGCPVCKAIGPYHLPIPVTQETDKPQQRG